MVAEGEAAPGDIAVRVRQRPDFGHWGSAEVLTSDRPFTVDTVRQYLTHRGFEIRHQLHPVVCVERDANGAISEIRDWRATPDRTSVIYTEFEGHLDADLVRDLEDNVRLCMEDLRLATDDFQAMLAKTDETIEVVWGYGEGKLRPAEEVEEIIAFLEWLKEVGFVFLGYREYDYGAGDDGRESVAVVRGTGLGILRREEGSSAWNPISMEALPAGLRVRSR